MSAQQNTGFLDIKENQYDTGEELAAVAGYWRKHKVEGNIFGRKKDQWIDLECV